MKFIKINGVVYDYSEHKLKMINLSRVLLEAIEGGIAEYGFSKEKESVFYNKKYDLELIITIKNKKKMKFV